MAAAPYDHRRPARGRRRLPPRACRPAGGQTHWAVQRCAPLGRSPGRTACPAGTAAGWRRSPPQTAACGRGAVGQQQGCLGGAVLTGCYLQVQTCDSAQLQVQMLACMLRRASRAHRSASPRCGRCASWRCVRMYSDTSTALESAPSARPAAALRLPSAAALTAAIVQAAARTCRGAWHGRRQANWV